MEADQVYQWSVNQANDNAVLEVKSPNTIEKRDDIDNNETNNNINHHHDNNKNVDTNHNISVNINNNNDNNNFTQSPSSSPSGPQSSHNSSYGSNSSPRLLNSSNLSTTSQVPGGVVTTQNMSTVIRPKGNTNSLQFVKIQPPDLSKKAVEQIRIAQESKVSKEKIKEVEEEWQNNLLEWKSKRRQQITQIHDQTPSELTHISDTNMGGRKVKTFAEIMEQRAKSGNRLGFNLQRYMGKSDDVQEKDDETIVKDNRDENKPNSQNDNRYQHDPIIIDQASKDLNDSDCEAHSSQSSGYNQPDSKSPSSPEAPFENLQINSDSINNKKIITSTPDKQTYHKFNNQELQRTNEDFQHETSHKTSNQRHEHHDQLQKINHKQQEQSHFKQNELQQQQQSKESSNLHDNYQQQQVRSPAKLTSQAWESKPQVKPPIPRGPVLKQQIQPSPKLQSIIRSISQQQQQDASPQSSPKSSPKPEIATYSNSQLKHYQQQQQQQQQPSRVSVTVNNQVSSSSLNSSTQSIQSSPNSQVISPKQLAMNSDNYNDAYQNQNQHHERRPIPQLKANTNIGPKLSPQMRSSEIEPKLLVRIPPINQQTSADVLLSSPKSIQKSRPNIYMKQTSPPTKPTPQPKQVPQPQHSQQNQIHFNQRQNQLHHPQQQAQQEAAMQTKQHNAPLPPTHNSSINKKHYDASEHDSVDNVHQKHHEDKDKTVLSISGKKHCSSCKEELGRGAAAFVVESLSLVYHTNCFRCSVCHVNLSNGFRGVDVRVHAGALHCQNCYSKDGLNYSRV